MTLSDSDNAPPHSVMAQPDLDRLNRVLGSAETRWVLDRARQRLERGQPLTGPIALSEASDDQRRAMEILLGRRPGRGKSLRVTLDEMDLVLKRSGMHPDGLAGAVHTLTGPVTVRSEAHAAMESAWQRALAPLEGLVGVRPEFEAWFTDRRTIALLRRQPNALDAVAALAAVLHALPANGIPLSKLAGDTTGDTHSLDAGKPLATMVLSAIRMTWWSGSEEPGTPAQRRRALWDTAGVLVDELSSTVLVLNLDALAGSRLQRITAPARGDGEPLVLTLRHIARHEVRLHPGPVYVCENPAVVSAAADRLGPACPTLLCVNGQPTTAAVRLLEAAHACGSVIHYHGDFDWGGLRIANLLRTRVLWRPWRYDRDAYLSAADKRTWRPLTGSAAVALWDPTLSEAMRDHGVRVEEEDVLEDLLKDLDSAATSGGRKAHDEAGNRLAASPTT